MASPLARAVIGRQLFGNPIPEAWYKTCNAYAKLYPDYMWNEVAASIMSVFYFDKPSDMDLCHMGLRDLCQYMNEALVS